MKNYKFKIIAFIAILVVPTIAWMGIKIISPSTYEKLDYDLGEKREKTHIESITQLASSGDVLSDYFADRAPFRSSLVSFYQKTNTRLEARYDNELKPAIMAAIYGTSTVEIDSDDSAYNELFGGNSQNTGSETGNNATGTGSDTSDGGSNPTDSEGNQVHEHDWVYAGGQDVSYDCWGYSIYFCSTCHEIEYTDWQNKLVDDSYMAPVVINDTTIMGRNGWLFLYGFGNIDYYKANNIMSEADMDAYMQTLITLDELCRERGIKLAVSIAPDKDQVYSEYMPTYTIVDEYKRTARLVDYIKNNSDIAISYPLAELKYCDRFWTTYRMYDTHWNNIGGYIGTQALYASIGMPVTDPMEVSIVAYEFGNAGDLIDLAGLDASGYVPDTDYFVDYKPDINITYETDGYSALQNIYRTESDSPNEEKLVMIGDSFRVAMIDYLKKDYSECMIYHRDVIASADEAILDCDVLVLQANERNDSRIISSAQYIIELLQRQ